MTATQMNIRIDSALKHSGDLAMREAGSSPSSMVKALWEYAARNRHKTGAIASLIDFLRDDAPAEPESATDRREAIVREVNRGPQIIEAFYREHGISAPSLTSLSYEQLKETAYGEEYPEMRP